MNPTTQTHFWRNHCSYPLSLFILLAITAELSGIDWRLADFYYHLEGGRWALKEAWITNTAIHTTGRNISLLLALSILLALMFSFFIQPLRAYRREFCFLLMAAGGSSAIVSGLKSLTHVSCPWDFSRYGGTETYASVFTQIWRHGANGDCFPAGHASGGYAWIALYFLGVHFQSRWRWLGLAFAISAGLLFGITQQLRGAHFISHDLWTLGICWFFSLLMYRLILVGHPNPKQ